MLPKKNRVVTKEVEKIFKEGRFVVSPNLTFKYFKNQGKEVKISFIVPKSVAKLAVKRNSLRRLGYKALEKQLNMSPVGIVGVFVFKKPQEDAFLLENEIKTIFSKIN